ncbi:MAG TPA: S1C family serine protease [Casimicrobiaceae bacterium]|nr:S1C family serine protease [Casimicrobiaceae bacterium]
MTSAVTLSSLADISEGLVRLVANASRSVVGVHSHRMRGSGFVWRPGLIVTSDEAVADEGPIEVALPGGEIVPASLKGRDASTDIALLRIDASVPEPAALAPDQVTATGALVIAIGAEDGRPVTAMGMIASVGPDWRSVRGGEIGPRIELDLRLRSFSEGGLALAANGSAIGMVVPGPRRRVLVIPARTVDRVAARLDADGRIARGYLGLGLQPVRIEGQVDRSGAMVMSVDPAGPGAASGVRQGDIVVEWNGRPLRALRSLVRDLGPDSVGTVVRLTATRAGEPVRFDVTIAARPDA